MRRYTLRLLGVPVLAVDVWDCYEEECEVEPSVGGGSSHNFERDYEPLSPTGHHEWEWDDKGRFGFS